MALGKIASIPGLCCHSDPHCLVALLWLCFIFRVVLGKPGFLLLSWLWEEVLQVLILLVERLCLFLPLTERAAPLVLDIICALNSTSLQDTDTVTFFFFSYIHEGGSTSASDHHCLSGVVPICKLLTSSGPCLYKLFTKWHQFLHSIQASPSM